MAFLPRFFFVSSLFPALLLSQLALVFCSVVSRFGLFAVLLSSVSAVEQRVVFFFYFIVILFFQF